MSTPYDAIHKAASTEKNVFKRLRLVQELIGLAPDEDTAMIHAREAAELRRQINATSLKNHEKLRGEK